MVQELQHNLSMDFKERKSVRRITAAGVLWLLASIILFLLTVPPAEGLSNGWETVGTGIEYRMFRLPDPNNVYVARMDRGNLNATIESSIAGGRLSGGFETVTGMADRYDQAINYWEQSWGSRNKVVVAINGNYYDIKTGIPENGQIHSGWYAKRFDDLGGGSGFAWTLNRTPFIGRCVTHPHLKQLIQKISTQETIEFSGINEARDGDELIIYTPQYDSNTRTNDAGLEILVEMTRPTLILPTPYFARGYVREIRNSAGSTHIPFDHIVLSASGLAMTDLSIFELGDEVGVSQEITDFQFGCDPPTWIDWSKTYASIGGSFRFLQDNAIVDFTDLGALERHPRTAIAYNDSYIYFIVVDGRFPIMSIGMTIHELAVFAKETLGAAWGIAQDGGGSSTMVINGKVVNIPNAELLTNKIFLPMIFPAQSANSLIPETNAGNWAIEEQEYGLLRPVANGMLMVVVEPMQQSFTYIPDNAVQLLEATAIRLGPGTNYGILATAAQGSQGVILEHFNHLNGVLAKGSFWWKVSIEGIVGWVPEESLASALN